MFKYSIAFMLFFVSIKVCHVIGLDTLLDCHIEAFTSVVCSVLFPLVSTENFSYKDNRLLMVISCMGMKIGKGRLYQESSN